MPIRSPERYPADWRLIGWRIKEAAGWKCEDCGALCKQMPPPRGLYDPTATADEQPELYAHLGPVLTVHHLDWAPENNQPWNLVPLCAACHLRIHGSKGWHPLAEQTRPLFEGVDEWWWRRKRVYLFQFRQLPDHERRRLLEWMGRGDP